MTLYERWLDAAVQFLQNEAPQFIVQLLAAIIVFVVGWFIAVGIGRLVAEVLKRLRFNQIFERIGWQAALERAELKLDPAGFVGSIFKWIFGIVVLLAVVDILGLQAFSDFLRDVLGYLPNVIAATFIFVAAVVIADIAEKVVRAAVEGTEVGYAKLASLLVRWSIWIFAIGAILTQLRVAEELVITLFQGVIAFVVIAGGIAFGLGGKDAAAGMIQDIKRHLH